MVKSGFKAICSKCGAEKMEPNYKIFWMIVAAERPRFRPLSHLCVCSIKYIDNISLIPVELFLVDKSRYLAKQMADARLYG